jgi:hypothetical protein
MKLSGNMVTVDIKGGQDCEIINYFDVWSDSEEGWTVNNSCVEEVGIFIADDDTDEDIIQKLKDMGLLTELSILGKTVNVTNTGDGWEIETLDEGMPLFGIRPIYE